MEIANWAATVLGGLVLLREYIEVSRRHKEMEGVNKFLMTKIKEMYDLEDGREIVLLSKGSGEYELLITEQ